MVERSTAYIVSINEVLAAPYVKTSGELEPNFQLIRDRKVSRVNLIGAVVSKEDRGPGAPRRIQVEDGTGSIMAMSFEEDPWFASVEVGQPVIVIGRVREYNQSKYIIPEIVKAIRDKGWLAVRKKVLELLEKEAPAPRPAVPAQGLAETAGDTVMTAVTEEVMGDGMEEELAEGTTPQQEVMQAIAKLDKGDGADIDQVIKTIAKPDTERMIDAMLREGDLYQIRPGRVKIL